MKNFSETTNFIWSVADLLRGEYKQSEYGKVVLPLTIIRRLDCVLAKTKQAVLAKMPQVESMQVKNIDPILNNVAGYNFHNHSKYDFNSLQLIIFNYEELNYSHAKRCLWSILWLFS